MTRLITLALAGALLAGCDDNPIYLWYPDTAAPWETVDGTYWPDSSSISLLKSKTGFETVEECRKWARWWASKNKDDAFIRGSYICAIGPAHDQEHQGHYRLKVK